MSKSLGNVIEPEDVIKGKKLNVRSTFHNVRNRRLHVLTNMSKIFELINLIFQFEFVSSKAVEHS